MLSLDVASNLSHAPGCGTATFKPNVNCAKKEKKAIKRKVTDQNSRHNKHTSSSATTALRYCLFSWNYISFFYIIPTFAFENVSNFSFLPRISCFPFQTSSKITCWVFARGGRERRRQAGGWPATEQNETEKWRTSGKSVLSICPVVSTIREKHHFRESFSSFFASL